MSAHRWAALGVLGFVLWGADRTAQASWRLHADLSSVPGGGVRVNVAYGGGAAARAGLRSGDIITHVNAHRINDYNDLIHTLQVLGDENNGSVTLSVRRRSGNGWRTLRIEAELDQRP